MPAAMTYSSLFTDVQRFLERGYVNDPQVFAEIPNLINWAERDIATKLKILGNLIVLTDTLVAGTSVYAKPDRWRATASINYGASDGAVVPVYNVRTPLFPRGYEYCRAYWPNSDTRAPPEFYADYDYNHILIVPTPDFAYPYEWNIWQLLPLLDAVNQSNWLTDFAPKALLAGTLVQSFPFLKDGPWTKEWGDKYTESLGDLNTEELQRVIDRTTVRRTV